MLSEIVLVLYFTVGLLGAPPAHVRIINGTDAREGEIPYIVSVRYDNMHSCGGSILDERHVLTAAHCVQSRILSHLTVQYGVVTITREASGPNITAIKKVHVNSNFEYDPSNGFRNDIAVLELEKPMIFGPNAQPVMLASAFNATPEHSSALLSGWGVNDTYSITSMDNLQKVSITVYSDDDCERIYALYHTNREYHICAGVPEGGKGHCSGDSGGPLIVNGFQVGIVSWTTTICTSKGYPGVFTKVSTQVPWIYQQMKNE